MRTAIQIEQLLQEIKHSIEEAIIRCKGARPIIRMAEDTHYDIWEHMCRKDIGVNYTGQEKPANMKKLYGRPIEIECTWIWGMAVAVEEVRDERGIQD